MSFSSLQSALSTMKNVDGNGDPIPFSIEFVQADRRRKLAGTIAKLNDCVLLSRRAKTTGAKHKEKLDKVMAKDPDHRANGTINILHQPSGRTKKVHIRLILRLNGTRVAY